MSIIDVGVYKPRSRNLNIIVSVNSCQQFSLQGTYRIWKYLKGIVALKKIRLKTTRGCGMCVCGECGDGPLAASALAV